MMPLTGNCDIVVMERYFSSRMKRHYMQLCPDSAAVVGLSPAESLDPSWQVSSGSKHSVLRRWNIDLPTFADKDADSRAGDAASGDPRPPRLMRVASRGGLVGQSPPVALTTEPCTSSTSEQQIDSGFTTQPTSPASGGEGVGVSRMGCRRESTDSVSSGGSLRAEFLHEVEVDEERVVRLHAADHRPGGSHHARRTHSTPPQPVTKDESDEA